MADAPLVDRLSFAGGQLGENLRARSDLGKYQISVEVMENFITMIEGGATRRPGTRMVDALKNSAQVGKLIPFRLSSVDHFMIVVNDGAARYLRNGGFLQSEPNVPYEIPVPFAEADIPNIRAAREGNIIYMVDGARFVEMQRFANLDWRVSDFVALDGPVETQNLDRNIIVKATDVEGEVALTTTGGTPFLPGHVGAVFRFDDADLSLTTEWSVQEAGVPVGVQRRWLGNVYVNVSTEPHNSGPAPPTHVQGDMKMGVNYVTWRFLHKGYGFVRIAEIIDPSSARGTVVDRLPDSVRDVGTYRWSPPAWSVETGFPRTIAFSRSRLYLGRGDKGWLSSLRGSHDFKLGDNDDDAIAFRLRAPDRALIEQQWAMPTGVLLLGTADIEWIVRGNNLYDSPTPKTVNPVDDGADGSAPIEPARVDGGVAFVGGSETRLHFASIDPQRQGSQRLETDELSVWARDLFEPGIAGLAWQRDPHRILWAWRRDGVLLGITYMPKQQMLAFHVHPMANGAVEDMDVIHSTTHDTDEVYLIVRRTIMGQTRRYVELLTEFFQPADRADPTAAGAWYLDCGLRYSGPAIDTFNVPHLAGQEVGVFANGAMQPRATVGPTGVVKIARKAADVLIGLPIKAQIRDLPRQLKTQTGETTADEKTIRQGVMQFLHTGGGMVRVVTGSGGRVKAASEFEPVLETGGKKYGAPIKLFSGIKDDMSFEAEFGDEAALEIVNDDAMPCTLLAMSPRLTVVED